MEVSRRRQGARCEGSAFTPSTTRSRRAARAARRGRRIRPSPSCTSKSARAATRSSRASRSCSTPKAASSGSRRSTARRRPRAARRPPRPTKTQGQEGNDGRRSVSTARTKSEVDVGSSDSRRRSSFRLRTSDFELQTSRPSSCSIRASRCCTACGPAPAALRVSETPQRKRFRRGQIAHAVLVMDGERLGRFAHDRRRTAAHLEQLPPARRPPLRTAARGATRAPAPQRLDPAPGRRRRAASGSGRSRALKRVARALVEPGARVDAAERERFARVARAPPARSAPGAAAARSAPPATADRGGCARAPPRADAASPRADELEVARRNLEARHVAGAPRAEHAAARAP